MHRMFLCWENINKGITMKVETAQRIHSVKEYYFSTKLREVAQLRKEGKPIINLGIGSPDLPPHVTVREKMASEISKSEGQDRKSTRLNSSHVAISYAVFCLKKKKKKTKEQYNRGMI